MINKNALSNGESRLLEDKFYCQLLFHLEYKTSGKRKIARRDKKTFCILIFSSENSFKDFTLKKLTIDF